MTMDQYYTASTEIMPAIMIRYCSR